MWMNNEGTARKRAVVVWFVSYGCAFTYVARGGSPLRVSYSLSPLAKVCPIIERSRKSNTVREIRPLNMTRHYFFIQSEPNRLSSPLFRPSCCSLLLFLSSLKCLRPPLLRLWPPPPRPVSYQNPGGAGSDTAVSRLISSLPQFLDESQEFTERSRPNGVCRMADFCWPTCSLPP